jgi:hypothetical protein
MCQRQQLPGRTWTSLKKIVGTMPSWRVQSCAGIDINVPLLMKCTYPLNSPEIDAKNLQFYFLTQNTFANL